MKFELVPESVVRKATRILPDDVIWYDHFGAEKAEYISVMSAKKMDSLNHMKEGTLVFNKDHKHVYIWGGVSRGWISYR